MPMFVQKLRNIFAVWELQGWPWTGRIIQLSNYRTPLMVTPVSYCLSLQI